MTKAPSFAKDVILVRSIPRPLHCSTAELTIVCDAHPPLVHVSEI